MKFFRLVFACIATVAIFTTPTLVQKVSAQTAYKAKPDATSGATSDATGAMAFVGYDRAPFHPVVGANGMVTAQEAIAATVGRDILAKGGNAVDAAVATGFALAVTFPAAGNIGGGGFMLIALADTDEVIAVDYREMAPAAASRDMFLGADGEVDNQKAQFSHLSAGVPGSVMGLLDALETYGTMSRKQVMAPAIKLAERGMPVTYGMASGFAASKAYLSKDPSTLEYFYKPGGALYKQGDTLKQKDLAKTLKRISRKGRAGFYEGKTAELMVDEMQRGGGLITLEDMKNYRAVNRTAVKGTYRGYEIFSMPPPSSGGVHVIQMLNILEGYDLRALEHNSADYLHLLIESMRRAYADRSKYLGDPDFFDVPVAKLIDKSYAGRLRGTINKTKASRSADIVPGRHLPKESQQTTHYSVMDKWGNAVSVTTTLNFGFGSGYSVDGAGFLLNNEMDDFSSKPGSPNGYGLIGGEANKIEPGKRPLSSMTPAIVKKGGKPYFVTGSPGGSTIITVVLQNILNVIDSDMNAMEAVTAPRIHHQWLPDVVITEPGISGDTIDILEGRGFIFQRDKNEKYARTTLGRANAIMLRDGFFYGAADLRSPTSGAAGY
ncbi:MAG: gamma-glutamyltransferase [Robiginitomaculum sp.]|nr:gamma-glutamyltransferase [Robiginitomaculum sp.]